MNDDHLEMGLDTRKMALPLHLQKLEKSLDVRPFLNQMNDLFQDHVSDDEKSISSDTSDGSNSCTNYKEEERVNKLRLYNMSNMGDERRWLQDILLSDSSDSCQSESDETITEDDFKDMLKFHLLRKKYQGRFYQKPENIQYQYYGAGLLSACDRFPDHQKLIVGNKKKKEKKCDKKVVKLKKDKPVRSNNNVNINNSCSSSSGNNNNKLSEQNCNEHHYQDDNNWNKIICKDEELDENDLDVMMKQQTRGRGRKKHNNKSPEVMAMRRRKIWIMMSKKELGKVQRAKVNNHKEMLINCKKISQNCMKYWRQKAMQSQKNMKETIWRAKRLTREMQSYWKRYDRVERETRRRLEKEAEEQRKMDVEMIEAKRQQRKLNFLITQTELYAHFMSRKVGTSFTDDEQLRILSQLDEEKNPRLIGIDNYDCELMKHKAKKNAIEAFDHEKARTRQFDSTSLSLTSNNTQELCLSDTPDNLEHPQPMIFKGNLKGYQLKGMNWLANLYDQGINGILADEMGLGKTVQSIAFLCHIAEKYSVWGPFLIISPSSTLHNWQQEMARFVPLFKVVPYWGNPQERRILRQFWETKDLHTKEASFHVVITSYQLFIADYKYFNRIKWQYMILDEAQAIKSSSSMRWKLLLGFSCRNRLLLSGTPIQNSMAELWALLHFIMPTLFDSHDEFNEWFSKDIESHAENKTGIDEKHLSRLHMILKPFMLRRIKKDVENELSDKIEIMVYCPLTTRQKLLYSALKQKIRIEELLHYTNSTTTAGGTSTCANPAISSGSSGAITTGSGGNGSVGGGAISTNSSCSNSNNNSIPTIVNPNINNPTVSESVSNDKSITSNLMNLVMQFRKVCNHPELFERRDAKSPLFINTESYQMPSFLYQNGHLNESIPSIKHLLYNKFCIFATEYIHRSLFNTSSLSNESNKCFSFSRFINISPMELNEIFISGILYRLCHNYLAERRMRIKRYWEDWWFDDEENKKTQSQLSMNTMLIVTKKYSSLLLDNTDLIFTKKIIDGEAIYTHTTNIIHSMPETMAHRILRSSKHISNQSIKSTRTHAMIKPELGEEPKLMLLPEHRHIQRPPIIRVNQPTIIPYFVCETNPKVQASQRKLYVSNSSAACAWRRHEQCGGPFGQNVLRIGCEQALLSTPEYNSIISVNNLHMANMFTPNILGGLSASLPINGWSNIIVPDKQTLVTDAGKLSVLDSLLRRLKEQGHRVLIYSQMTKMIDLLEEYMYHRKHTFMRLDGSSKISDRRDMVADFQKRADIFVFLLSTRAGGLGINLTAADTVIFYDSDWNPTVDQQAMDRAHRLGQTKQVTVYRLICKGTIEERILQRAREKSEIQRMVISGGNFKPDTLKPKEVVSLLLDDEEIEAKYSQRSEERKQSTEESRLEANIHSKERDRKRKLTALPVKDTKKLCLENKSENINNIQQPILTLNNDKSNSINDHQIFNNEEFQSTISPPKSEDETSNEGLVVDVDGPVVGASNCRPPRPLVFNEPQKIARIGQLNFGMGSGAVKNRVPMRGTSKRGRPRGSRRGGPVGGKGRGLSIHSGMDTTITGSPSNSGVQGNCGPADGDGPSTVGPLGPIGNIGHMVSGRGQAAIRRGPGRPRLRPTGPVNQGNRRIPPASSSVVVNSNHGKCPVAFHINQISQSKTVSGHLGSNNLTEAKQSSSSTAESRPFGFYTQQQLPNRD